MQLQKKLSLKSRNFQTKDFRFLVNNNLMPTTREKCVSFRALEELIVSSFFRINIQLKKEEKVS